MAVISRITTWASNQNLTASALNGEFNNIVNAWNNHDSASSRWNNIDSTVYKKIGVTALIPLQIIQFTTVTQYSASATGTWQSTNLQASITPNSASSKVLIFAKGVSLNTSASTVYCSIFRGATNLGSAGFGLHEGVGSGGTDPVSMFYYDSPSTTSAVIYSVSILSNSGTNKFGANSTQTMILVEIL